MLVLAVSDDALTGDCELSDWELAELELALLSDCELSLLELSEREDRDEPDCVEAVTADWKETLKVLLVESDFELWLRSDCELMERVLQEEEELLLELPEDPDFGLKSDRDEKDSVKLDVLRCLIVDSDEPVERVDRDRYDREEFDVD